MNTTASIGLPARFTLRPFGMLLSGRNWSTGSSYRYAFNGMEFDYESSEIDFGARNFDPRLGRWLSADAKASKYPDLSPYTGLGDNPIIFVDPDGKTLYISGDLVQAKADILAMVPQEYQSRISFVGDGDVLMVVYDLSTELGPDYPQPSTEDMGSTLLVQLTDPTGKNYLYSVTDTYQEEPGPESQQYKSYKEKQKPFDPDYVSSASGIHNGSKTANACWEKDEEGDLWNKSVRVPVDIQYTNNGVMTTVDVDGQVTISNNGTFVNLDGTPKERANVVFHELWENYEKTTNGLPHHYGNYDTNGNAIPDPNSWAQTDYDPARLSQGAHAQSVEAASATGDFAGTTGFHIKENLMDVGSGRFVWNKPSK